MASQKDARALGVSEETLAATRAAYGEDLQQVAKALLDMAGIYYPMNRVTNAERVTREGLAMARRTYPPRARILAYGASQMAFLLRKRGAWAEVLPLLLEVYDIDKTQRAEGSAESVRNLTEVGEAHLELKQYDEARKALEEAVTLRQKGLPAGDWRTENSRSLFGAALAGLDRRSEAEKLLASSASALATSKEAPAEVKSKAQKRASSLLR